VDKLFLGVDGLHTEKGVTTHYEREAILNRMMAEVAQQVIAVTDSSKFGRMCLHKIIDLDGVDVLITDTGAQESALAAIRRRDIEVIAV
jgi:DeoR family transcriptional regulator of aga operon